MLHKKLLISRFHYLRLLSAIQDAVVTLLPHSIRVKAYLRVVKEVAESKQLFYSEVKPLDVLNSESE